MRRHGRRKLHCFFFCCSVAVRSSVDGQIASNFYAKYHRHRDRLRGDHDSSEPAHHDCRADAICTTIVMSRLRTVLITAKAITVSMVFSIKIRSDLPVNRASDSYRAAEEEAVKLPAPMTAHG